jgi:prepilin-type N-terminal cleavage/methylation domain-containing protein
VTQRGLTFIEVLVTASILVIVSLGFHTVMNDVFHQGRKKTVAINSLASVRKEIMQMLWSNTVWQNLIAGNASLNCLTATPANCAEGDIGQVEVFDLTGTRLYHQDGFTLNGDPCTTPFDAVNGNPECPFRFRFDLTLSCEGAPVTCADPLVRIRGQLEYKEPNLKVINVNRYSISLVRRSTVSVGASNLACFNVSLAAQTMALAVDPLTTSPPADASFVTTYAKGFKPNLPADPAVNVYWGFICNPGWRVMGCSLRTIGSSDNDKFIDINGCWTDNDEWNRLGILTGVCCRVE